MEDSMNIPSSEGFDLSNLSAPLLQVVQQEQAEKQAQANKAPAKVRDISNVDGGVIAKFNAKYTTEEALRLSGKYTKQSNDIWLFNESTSGAPGGHVTENGKFYTYHESDRHLYDGHSHDAFDIFVAHWCNGDFSKAVAQAATDIDPEGQKQRQFDHVKAKGTLTPSPNPETAPQAKFGSLFIDGNSLLSVPAKKEYLIRDVIEANSTILIFGPSGGGKTFVSDDMGLSCSCGLQWNGHDVKQGLVIVFNGEGFGGKPRRIKAWSKAKGITDLSNYIISKQTVNFETDVQHIILEIESIMASKGLSPVLLIIDTLARHLFGDENSAKDVMKFLKIVESIRCHFSGCSVMIVTHTGNDENNLHRARGSSSTKAAVEIELSINKGIITFTKTKDSELPKPIEFKLVQVEIGTDEETGEMITSCFPLYGERSERNKSKEFTRIEAVAIQALVEVAAKEKRNANGKYIGSTKAWREHFYNIRLAEDSEVTPDALKKGFQRTVTALKDKEALEQLSTDSILIMEEHQERINGAITAGNMLINRTGGQETLWGQ
jgi:hypothetical protein